MYLNRKEGKEGEERKEVNYFDCDEERY